MFSTTEGMWDFGASRAAPATTFATIGAPTDAGRVVLVSDVGPAPGIELVADGTRWRPRGGRQVLAMRANNPVTVQALFPGDYAETIGPFPGGLVRAGMKLEISFEAQAPSIGTDSRTVRLWAGPAGALTEAGQFFYVLTTNNSLNLNITARALIRVLADGSANHSATPSSGANGNGIASISSGEIITLSPPQSPSINFSQPWEVAVVMRSAVETAVNISSATWAGGIATFNTSEPHTLAVGDKTVIASVTPSGWNIPDGAIVLSVPTTTQFTVALAADPGTYSTGGTSSRISNMISQSYVLELVG